MDAELSCIQQHDSTDDTSSSIGRHRCGSKGSDVTRSTIDSLNSDSSFTSNVKSVRAVVDRLVQQDVVIFNLSIGHIDFSETAAGQSWKLKCRMNGKTFWKSDAQKAERCAGGRFPRRAFHGSATQQIVYEGGDSIEFELCNPSLFGSKVVAKCAVSVSEALHLRHHLFDLGLTSVHDTSGKIFAHLQVDLKVLCAPLGSIGISSLKETPVPAIPTFRIEFLAGEARSLSSAKITECDRFIAEAEHARKSLQSAVDLYRSLQP